MPSISFERSFFFQGDMLGISKFNAMCLKPPLQTEHCSLVFLITQHVHRVESSLGPVSNHSPQFRRRDLPSQDLKVNCILSRTPLGIIAYI